MKRILKLSLIVVTLLFITGCESKDLTSYIEEQTTDNNKKIGYIKMEKSKFKKLATQKEFKKLMDYVKDQNYEYFMVDFENKKGLFCISPNCLYEKIDKDSNGVYTSGTTFYGKIEQNDDDIYKYRAYKN